MITLEVFGPDDQIAGVVELLERLDSADRIRSVVTTSPEHSVLTARIARRSVDLILSDLRKRGIPEEDFTLSQTEDIGRVTGARLRSGLVWEDLLGRAGVNSRPAFYYLAFMVVAGVIAGYGVVDGNGILIVGAMAVSPDLLPITAAAVGLVSRRPAMVARALATVALGMAIAALAAAAFTFAQDALGLLPTSFNIDSTILRGLTNVGDETIVVALAAGIAGMLALETRASAAVGVAISVTTIPAAAYLGVAIGLGDLGTAGGALAVLVTNVTMMILGASLALATQRWLDRRAA
jgi:uncharacterized hydrophobic protein (TIGR00271 family)